jgi:hypothetical protein
MLTHAEAREKLISLLSEWGRHIDGGLALMEEKTVAKSYGWVFFYDSRQYIETRSVFDAIGGNGPVVVLAESGEVVRLGPPSHQRRSSEHLNAISHCSNVGGA